VYINIRLAAAILVNIFNGKSYAEPVSDSIDGSTDDFGLDSNSSLMSSKLGFNTMPTLLP